MCWCKCMGVDLRDPKGHKEAHHIHTHSTLAFHSWVPVPPVPFPETLYPHKKKLFFRRSSKHALKYEGAPEHMRASCAAQPITGFMDHLCNSLHADSLVVQYTAEVTHPGMGSAKLSQICRIWQLNFSPSSASRLNARGMRWAHEDGMSCIKSGKGKVEWSHIERRGDEWLERAPVAARASPMQFKRWSRPCILYSFLWVDWFKLLSSERCSFLKMPHLVHTVQELQEDGREAAALAAGTQVASLAKLMAKGEPLFLQQHLETLQRPVERIT